MQDKISHPLLMNYSNNFRVSDWILSYFPKHKVYVEPFGGAASLLLNKLPSTIEIFNDLNIDVFNFFNILRDNECSQKLAELINLTPYSRMEYKAAFKKTDDKIEKARRFLIRSHMTVFSDALIQNTSSSPSSLIESWNDQPKCIQYASQRLKKTIIENMDPFEVIDKYDGNETLFFIDTPIPKKLNTASNAYLFEKLNNLKGMVIMCGWYDSQLPEILPNWTLMKKNGTKLTNDTCLWICPKSKQYDLFNGIDNYKY
ncbi:TPA: DNA adenine methylase [Acinetobacter baumannii]|uniref:DNA adenine methylase n=1 Tax=Acinetobacter baumannii TaxID=470 RepID=UPI00338F540D